MNLEKELMDLIEAKRGSKELALFYQDDGWSLSLGNPSRFVMLGEVYGEFESTGSTIGEAILEMKKVINVWMSTYLVLFVSYLRG